MRVITLDQIGFPITRPFFHRLLALDGFLNITKLLEPNKAVYFVTPAEAEANYYAGLEEPAKLAA